MERQQERLKTIKAQQIEAQADLKRQKSQLNSLTKASETTLSQLRKEAEKTPSERFIRLTKQCEDLNGEILSLTVRKTQTTELVEAASETLTRLDNEIIETDAVYKQLRDRVVVAKQNLHKVRQETSFQVAVEADLKNEIADLQRECEALDKLRINLLGEEERLTKIVKGQQTKSTTFTHNIEKLLAESERLQTVVDRALERLNQIGKQDITFRKQLANEKLKVQQQERGIKSQKAELKEELNVLQQIHPKLITPKPDKSSGYMKI